MTKGKFESLLGRRFGRLTVTALEPNYTKNRNTKWLCRCDCGNETIVRAASLKRSYTKSCGCLNTEQRHTNYSRGTHRHTIAGKPSRTYNSYRNMLERCYNKNRKEYHNYGGRGITVCARWRKSFENFLADMGERPIDKSLDRWPNNNAGYKPNNCRWATKKEQSINSRRWPTSNPVTGVKPRNKSRT